MVSDKLQQVILPPWMWQGKPLKELGKYRNLYGFVYWIRFADDKQYIGKKEIWNIKTMPQLQNGKVRDGHLCFVRKHIDSKYVLYERIAKESDWQTYCGSIEYHKPPVERRILEFAGNKALLTYLEVKYQFKYDAIESEDFLNINILGRFYREHIKSARQYRKPH